MSIHAIAAPDRYRDLIGPAPGVIWRDKPGTGLSIAHLFVTERVRLEKAPPRLIKAVEPNGAIWVSWSKKSSGIKTDITEDTIRAVAPPLGLVDIKVCAVDEGWSGLKLVIRKELRGQKR